jgi:indole-3-glycerol phosphate synthase
MKTILDRIITDKWQEVISLKKTLPLSEIKNRIDSDYRNNSLCRALSLEGASGIIAEFKRRSPSKGIISNKLQPSIVTKGYADAGASGLSVLTDEKYFGGFKSDLSAAREANPNIPILRKDFMVDEYQIYEARMLKADLILLIAAVLGKSEIADFTSIAHELGMEVLLELHDENELDKIDERVDMIGINNRNLKDFSVDIDQSLKLLEKLPKEILKISESGLSDPEMVKQLKTKGFSGFLMGENFMKANDPGKACRDFIQKLKH